MAHDNVPIKIDKTNLKTPTPTAGAALYMLGNVDTTSYDLWLEVQGPGEDQLIPSDTSSIEVKPGSHFYTAKKLLNPGNV